MFSATETHHIGKLPSLNIRSSQINGYADRSSDSSIHGRQDSSQRNRLLQTCYRSSSCFQYTIAFKVCQGTPPIWILTPWGVDISAPSIIQAKDNSHAARIAHTNVCFSFFRLEIYCKPSLAREVLLPSKSHPIPQKTLILRYGVERL